MVIVNSILILEIIAEITQEAVPIPQFDFYVDNMKHNSNYGFKKQFEVRVTKLEPVYTVNILGKAPLKFWHGCH